MYAWLGMFLIQALKEDSCAIPFLARQSFNVTVPIFSSTNRNERKHPIQGGPIRQHSIAINTLSPTNDNNYRVRITPNM